tara:strand:+ start:32155 stop:32631 length:477 start_codon:yes stop_codon:yes gene_type:complete
MLTHERLKEKLYYNPETGAFTHLTQNRSHCGSLNPKGYIRIKVDNKGYLAHRLAWMYVNGKMPPDEIDHINHIKNDNRLSNLREASAEENNRNKKKSQKNKSGFTGVFCNKSKKKWIAQVMVNRECRHLGSFDSLIDAVAARMKANRENDFHPNHGKD